MSVNFGRHLENITIGGKLFSKHFWELLMNIPPHMPVSLFYAAMSPLLVYLEFSATQPFGVHVFEESTGLSWAWLVVLFALCGWITAQERNPVVYALATLPMLFYAGLLFYGAATNQLSILGLTAVVYLVVGALAVLGTVRYSIEVAMLRRKNDELSREVAQIKQKALEGK